MKVENKEIKIAVIVGIIMITICILACIIASSSKKNVESIDIKVYKLFDIEGTEDEHEYRACKINTDDLVTINKEFKKIQKLSDDKKVLGHQINGNYKIIVSGTYIAFDAEKDNYVYRNDIGAIFEYNTSLYDYVKKICE